MIKGLVVQREPHNLMSDEDASIDATVSSANPDEIRTCEWCSKPYVPTGRNSKRQKRCKRKHYYNCVVCGEKFYPNTDKDPYKETCSRSCANKLKGTSLKKTMLDKYGVENASQVKEFKEKAQKKINAKIDTITAKREKTMVERYGAKTAMQVPALKAKIQATNVERYGNSNPSKSEEVISKIKEKLNSTEVRNKRIATNRARYGTDFPAQNSDVLTSMKQTCLTKYGHEWAIQHPEYKAKMLDNMKKTMLSKHGVDHPSKIPGIYEKAKATMLERYGVEWWFQVPFAQGSNDDSIISKANIRFKDLLDSVGLDCSFEKHIHPYSYDICLEDLNLVIEIDPTYTHNAIGNHWGVVRDNRYHLSKTEVANAAGYRCIHVFDWDDPKKVVETIRASKTLYARNLEIRSVEQADVKEFLNLYHLQSSVYGIKNSYGLYLDDELIELMVFGYPRYNKNYEWELLRLCTRSGYKVVGGAERLFKHFVKTITPKSVISYCDIAKFDGSVYERLGMTLIRKNPPAKVWSLGGERITDSLLRQRGFDQLFHTNYGKGTSNEELMLDHGWLPVYDCGQQVWVWRNN